MVSSGDEKKVEEFVERFKKVCNSDQPTQIAKLLDISYQAAKNYLNGRYPDTKTLYSIVDNTPYSIHWLLTGKGEKFVDESNVSKSVLFVDKLSGVADVKFLKAFEAFFEEYTNPTKEHTSTDSPTTVTLTSDKVRDEKVEEKDSSDLPS